MQQYALLKHVGRNEYVVLKYTDHCLGVLAYFLTDGGSPDYFVDWINKNQKGETVGKVIFLRKNGDDIIIGLSPTMTGKKDQFKTTIQDLFTYIDTWKEKTQERPLEVLIKRNGENIEFDIVEHQTRKDTLL